MIKTDAHFSNDRQHRYWLLRIWDDTLPLGCSIGINPSTADETINDPTVRKDMGFLTRFGFGGLLKLNVGAYRATDPRHWRAALDPIGPLNKPSHLLKYLDEFKPGLIIAAWGKNGNYARPHCKALRDQIGQRLMCLGINPDGTPKHTLMLPYTTPLQAFHDHYDGQNECVTCDRWAGKVGALHG
jgi:hypothetical protein